MTWKQLMIAVLLLMGVASPAWADLDHQCLNQCVSQGAANSACMKQCSYGKDAETDTTRPPSRGASTHNVLHTLTPVKPGDILVKPKKTVTVAPDKDYSCLKQCLQNGRVYTACETACVKPTCAPGGVMCAQPSRSK